jgi:menaquinol-cytochrome c reductase iron-sulfur subunit
MTSPPATGETTSRRGFMGVVVAASALAIGALLAVPGVGYVLDPLLRAVPRLRGWRRVAALASVPRDAPLAVTIEGEQRDAWTRSPRTKLGTVYLRRVEDRVVALSGECPHLGCTIRFDPGHARFGCPCHRSNFTLEGRQTTGPSPRPMDELETRVVNGQVEVRFVRYRTGTPERQEIG